MSKRIPVSRRAPDAYLLNVHLYDAVFGVFLNVLFMQCYSVCSTTVSLIVHLCTKCVAAFLKLCPCPHSGQ